MEGKLEEARNEGKEEVASNQIKEVVKEEVKDKAVEIREGKQELEETEEIEEKVEVANVQSQPVNRNLFFLQSILFIHL